MKNIKRYNEFTNEKWFMKNPISKAISDLEIILNDLPDENEFDDLYTNIINKIDKIRKQPPIEVATKLVEFAKQAIGAIYSEKMKIELEEYIHRVEHEFHLADVSNIAEDVNVKNFNNFKNN